GIGRVTRGDAADDLANASGCGERLTDDLRARRRAGKFPEYAVGSHVDRGVPLGAPVLSERADIHGVETEAVEELGDRLLGCGVITGDRQRRPVRAARWPCQGPQVL